MQEAYLDLKRKVKEREEDFRKCEAGELILQKQALEENLRLLSEEVETLSTKNERLLADLRKKDFYEAYNNVIEEVILTVLISDSCKPSSKPMQLSSVRCNRTRR